MPDPKVVVIGAGPAGLAVGLALARRGRPVTLVERDPAQPLGDPAGAFERWVRPGVAHHRLPHSLLGRTRRALRENAPDVLDALLRAGAWENDLRARLVRDAAGPGDGDLVAVHCRRPFFECALRRAVEDEPLVSVVSATTATGLVLQQNGAAPPRVAGVRLQDGELEADVVIDAGGRQSPIRRSLEQAGVPLPVAQVEPCGVIYYCRYYRLLDEVDYPAWTGVLGPSGMTECARCAMFFGDNRTFAVALGAPASARAFRAFAREEAYSEAVSRFKALAPFIHSDVAAPITGIVAFGSLQNVFHPPLLDGGAAPVRGLHFIGDAFCHTNPLFAWGLCLALDYGFRLGRIIDEHSADVESQALAFSASTSTEAEQCFRALAEEDHDRTRAWDGAPPTGPWLGRTFAGFVRHCAQPAALVDATVARAVLRRSQLLDLPDDLLKQEATLQRVIALQPALPQPPPGFVPSKDELLDIVARHTPAPR
jgi:2-polyprenyl-6-methoxyphenol hydroxylase-like FAD-dependent oxidoreductase